MGVVLTNMCCISFFYFRMKYIMNDSYGKLNVHQKHYGMIDAKPTIFNESFSLNIRPLWVRTENSYVRCHNNKIFAETHKDVLINSSSSA